MTMKDWRDEIKKGSQRYFHEYFNLIILLRGKIEHLEQIKEYIVKNYVLEGEEINLIKPTYSKGKLCFVSESKWNDFTQFKRKSGKLVIHTEDSIQDSLFNFACVLRGETVYLEEIKDFINREFASKELVEIVECAYMKHKTYIVEESEWNMYVASTEESCEANTSCSAKLLEDQEEIRIGKSLKATALVVSARHHGNCYDFAEFMLERLKDAGVETELVNFLDYEIVPCQRCKYECLWSLDPEKGVVAQCPINDDVPKIWEKALNSEIVILFIPTYGGLPPALWVAFTQRTQGLSKKVKTEMLTRSIVAAVVLASPHWSGIAERTPSVTANQLKYLGGEIAGHEVINSAGFRTENIFGRLINEKEIQRRLEFLTNRILEVIEENLSRDEYSED